MLIRVFKDHLLFIKYTLLSTILFGLLMSSLAMSKEILTTKNHDFEKNIFEDLKLCSEEMSTEQFPFNQNNKNLLCYQPNWWEHMLKDFKTTQLQGGLNENS